MADRRIGHSRLPDGCLRERLPQLVEIVLSGAENAGNQ
jgi:hypothetical protein